jgi:predicted permease
MEALVQDVRYALRALIKSPGFALVAVITLALGIGANTAIFSVVNGVLLQPLPFDRPDQLVWAAEQRRDGGMMSVAWPNFQDWRNAAHSFDGMVAFNGGSTTILGGEEPVWANTAAVTQDFWKVFPVTPVAGRLTNADDHHEGAAPVTVVARSFARDALGTENAVGRVIENRGVTMEVVGILPDDFAYPGSTEVWAPAELIPQGQSRTAHNWSVVGRLQEGTTLEEAATELDELTHRIVAGEVEQASPYLATGAGVVLLKSRIVGDSGRPLILLLGAAGLVLLVACTNLATALLARGAARAGEFAVRTALGASRPRIVRQLLAESFVLALAGGVAGVALTELVVRALRTIGAASVPRVGDVRIDGIVLAFTLLLSVITAVLFGLLPAMRSSSDPPADQLRAGGRGNASFSRRIWNTLVASEVALALVLLIGSGLLVRSLVVVLSQDAGFDGDDVAVTTLVPSNNKYPDLESHRRFWDGMLARSASIPGPSAAAVMSSVPLGNFIPNGRIELDGDPEKYGDALYVVASPQVFDVLDVPLHQGRTFDDRDGPDAPHVVVVSESFANRYWPGEDPIGHQVSGGGMDNYWDSDPVAFGTVVGVVGDVRFETLTTEPEPTVYWSYRQRPYRLAYGGILLVESANGDPALVAPSVRSEVRAADPDIAVRLEYLSDRISESVAERRFVLVVLGGFALLGLVLAAVGIYGVVSYAVARRIREMGIRLALGAAPGNVRRLVLKEGLRPVALGLLLGIAGALALARMMQGLLYEVGAADPLAFVSATLILLGTGWVASWVPAVRSTRVDPMITMRAE